MVLLCCGIAQDIAPRMENQVIETKCVLIGNAAVGKTSITQRFIRNEFTPQQQSTSGSSFLRYNYSLNNKTIKFQLWDTAGQERFRSLAAMCYRGANAIVITFDVTNQTSLDDVKYWHEQTLKNGAGSAYFVLLGNKIDMQRVVSREQCEAVARELKIPYFECSALSGVGIQEVFHNIANERATNAAPMNSLVSNSVVLQQGVEQEKRGGCC